MLNLYIFISLLNIHTTAGDSGLTGWNVTDFAGLTPVTYDNRSNFNSGTNAFVADIPGLYKFTGLARFNVGAVGSPAGCSALFEVDGSDTYGGGGGTSVGTLNSEFTVIIPLNATQSVTMKTYADAEYTLETLTRMNVEYLRPLT